MFAFSDTAGGLKPTLQNLELTMKGLLFFGAIIIAFFTYGDYSKQKRAEERAAKVAACESNIVCRTKKANNEAYLKSIFASTAVRSSTGTFYFKGSACQGDCSGHIAGYQWAEERGISKNGGCSGYSQSFIEGCMKYVSARVAELEDEEQDEQDDD